MGIISELTRRAAALRRDKSGSEKSAVFIAVVLMSVLAALVYDLRADSVFACPSIEREDDYFLAYCQANAFGDYDHGAFWHVTEETAVESAARATVLFLGNSRLQFGLSANPLDEWFGARSASYYLLGFSHYENHTFLLPLLQRIEVSPDIYVINLDLFFDDRLSPPAGDVMTIRGSHERYLEKRRWRRAHSIICGVAGFLCRREVAFYRSASTGRWLRIGGDFDGLGADVSYDNSVDSAVVEQYVTKASDFLADLDVNRNCVILTNTPQSDTSVGTAGAVARQLNLPFVAPELEGLRTFDGSHLDRASAVRWSLAFLSDAAPFLQDCLDVGRS